MATRLSGFKVPRCLQPPPAPHTHRPEWKGWAVKSELSLHRIRELATTWKQEV